MITPEEFSESLVEPLTQWQKTILVRHLWDFLKMRAVSDRDPSPWTEVLNGLVTNARQQQKGHHRKNRLIKRLRSGMEITFCSEIEDDKDAEKTA